MPPVRCFNTRGPFSETSLRRHARAESPESPRLNGHSLLVGDLALLPLPTVLLRKDHELI